MSRACRPCWACPFSRAPPAASRRRRLDTYLQSLWTHQWPGRARPDLGAAGRLKRHRWAQAGPLRLAALAAGPGSSRARAAPNLLAAAFHARLYARGTSCMMPPHAHMIRSSYHTPSAQQRAVQQCMPSCKGGIIHGKAENSGGSGSESAAGAEEAGSGLQVSAGACAKAAGGGDGRQAVAVHLRAQRRRLLPGNARPLAAAVRGRRAAGAGDAATVQTHPYA